VAYEFDAPRIVKFVERLQNQNARRDVTAMQVLQIRDGDYSAFAQHLPEEFPQPLIANLIDTAARDMAESQAAMPSFSCGSPTTTNDTERKFSDKRSRIALSYVQRSRLGAKRVSGTDRYNTLGYMIYVVDAVFSEKAPIIRIVECPTSYYTLDGLGRVKHLAEVYTAPKHELAARFPEYESVIKSYREEDLDVIHWYDENCQALILRNSGVCLVKVPNPISRTPAAVVQRPSITSTPHGQFDDVVWVQLARAIIANYTMEALDQAINAPIQFPSDVQEATFGPTEAIVTDGEIKRVRLDLPQGIFPEQQMLQLEQMQGSRYPQGRSGSIDASIITGNGVDALNGVFTTQIQTFHLLDTIALTDIISMCFEMDEALWPDLEKTIRVHDAGSPYEVKYKPSRDIKGDYSVDTSYGAVAGLDANRALVFLLQGLAAGVISKETVQRFLPVDIDPVSEKLKIDLEQMDMALGAAIDALPQAIPAMAMQGGDPVDVILKFAMVRDERQKGRPLHEAVKKVFVPKEQPAAPAGAPPPAGPPGAPGAASPEDPASALLQSLTGMTAGGQPNMQANVVRQQPI